MEALVPNDDGWTFVVLNLEPGWACPWCTGKLRTGRDAVTAPIHIDLRGSGEKWAKGEILRRIDAGKDTLADLSIERMVFVEPGVWCESWEFARARVGLLIARFIEYHGPTKRYRRVSR